MSDVPTILPPSSSALERAIDSALPRQWDVLADQAEPWATAGNAAMLPWVVQQWQVVQFAPYFDSLAELLAEAVPWLMERGSAASVRRALGWLGYDSVTIDEDGAWLHIDAGQALTADELQRVAEVVRASLPAHVHFFRVFHGYDLRPIVLDKGPALDAGMLDGYSGTPGAAGLQVSFGERRARMLPTSAAGHGLGLAVHQRTSLARYDDMPVLDAWRLDSHVLAGVSGGFMELSSGTCAAPTPGVPIAARSQPNVRVARWAAPPPQGLHTATAGARTAEPVAQGPRWAGPWAQAHGGAWEPVFWLIQSEET